MKSRIFLLLFSIHSCSFFSLNSNANEFVNEFERYHYPTHSSPTSPSAMTTALLSNLRYNGKRMLMGTQFEVDDLKLQLEVKKSDDFLTLESTKFSPKEFPKLNKICKKFHFDRAIEAYPEIRKEDEEVVSLEKELEAVSRKEVIIPEKESSLKIFFTVKKILCVKDTGLESLK